MICQCRFEFSGGFRFVPGSEQGQPKMVTERGIGWVLLRQDGERLDGAIKHVLLQVNIAERIQEVWFLRSYLKGALRQLDGFVQTGRVIRQLEGEIVQSEYVVRIGLQDIFVARPGLFESPGLLQDSAQR